MKNKRNILIAVILGILLLTYLETRAPKAINKTPSFSRYDKIPFGSFVVHKFLADFFPSGNVFENNLPLLHTLADLAEDDTPNFLFIDLKLEFDRLETNAMMDFTERGGNIFLAAERFRGHLADTLNIATSFFPMDISDSLQLQFTSPFLQTDSGYRFRHDNVGIYFTGFDSSRAVILATNSQQKVTLLRIPNGDGQFIFSSTPFIFTNYNMLLAENYRFIATALSFLDDTDVYWDEYYKERRRMFRTPIRFILSQPALKSAYFIILLGVLLFIIFQGRRKQRIIPVINPLQNTTLEFVNIVGRLYFNQRDHKKMAQKKINHFLEFLRENYRVNTAEITPELHETLARKTTRPLSEIENLFNFFAAIGDSRQISVQELLKLNRMIESWYPITESIQRTE
ncbi:MAG: hypothetical protein KDE52_02380 [Calditrichaeota bacterium]|nr:hypothetical protein [Calditrichota bacterium]